MPSQDAKINAHIAEPTSLETNLQTRIEEHNNELSISNLHFDVLSNIFLLCQMTDSIWEQNLFPWNVSHVCKQWRATALSTPLLWNTILLTRRAYNHSKLEAHLIRSGTCFLDIYISSFSTYDMHAFMDVLIAHCTRWRKFYVNGDRKITPLLLKYLREVHTPLLEHLYLTGGGIRVSIPVTRPSILHDASSLRFVHLSGPLIAALQPPLTNVTTLELGSGFGIWANPDDFVRFFGGMCSLVNLSLCGIEHRLTGPLDATTRVTLPLLRALRILDSGEANLFQLLVLPCLETLVLPRPDDIHLPILPTVKNLILGGYDCVAESDFINLVRSCPSLTHLSVDGTYDVCEHWQRTDDITWPSLQTVTVRNSANLLVLGSIVFTRIAQGYPIKEVFLTESSRTVLEKYGRLDWLENCVKMMFSDDFEEWSTITGFEGPPWFSDID